MPGVIFLVAEQADRKNKVSTKICRMFKKRIIKKIAAYVQGLAKNWYLKFVSPNCC
jgi:hypothetical protein